jgi:hypothetical protein
MSPAPDFHDELDCLQGHLPDWAARNLHRLRQPRAVWVRVPAGIVFVGGGVLSFLPVLGIWMLPLGLALLAVDVPPMRRPMARALRFANGQFEKRKNGKRAKQEAQLRR